MHEEHQVLNEGPPLQPHQEMRPTWAAVTYILDRAFEDDPRVTPHVDPGRMYIEWKEVLSGRWPLEQAEAEECTDPSHHFTDSEWSLLLIANDLHGGVYNDGLCDDFRLLTDEHATLVFEALAAARAYDLTPVAN